MRTLCFRLLLLLCLAGPIATQAAPGNPASATPSHYFVVNLFSAFEPIPDKLVPRDIPGNVYKTRSVLFGQTIYFVRLGFYASAGEARAAKERLESRFPGAHVAEVPATEYFRYTGGKPAAPPPRETTALPSPPAAIAPPVPAPVPIPDRAVATTPAAPVTAPVAAMPAEPPAAAKPLASGSVEEQAASLMDNARAAMKRADNREAVRLLGQLLKLPPNKQSREAQELIGVAHERLRDLTLARQEYTLYLRLYPEGPDADRVRQRLASLEAATSAPPGPLKKVDRQAVNERSVYGSLSQYYYNGKSQTDISIPTLGPTLGQTSLTATDQSALFTHLDVRARFRGDEWDQRLVVRDTYLANFLQDAEDTNRLYSAYYDVANKVHEYSGRFGRQPGTTGGVLGRFDGVTMGYNVLPKWRLNLVGGIPVEFNPIDSDKRFFGSSLDFGLFANHWNGSFYFIQQTVDNIADRQAIGTEWRYFDPKGSALLYLDYDTLFSALNIAMFQSTWRSSNVTTWNLLLDHRLAPTLTTSNALFGLPALQPGDSSTSITHWMQTYGYTEEELRQIAEDNTPTYDMAMLGVSRNLNATWQLGGDIKYYKLSAPPAAAAFTTILGSGATMMYTVQTIANGLFRPRDLSVASLSYLDSDTYQGSWFSLTNRMLFQDRWTADLALGYYQQENELGGSLQRYVPSIRTSYRWRKQLSFEAELGIEKSTTESVDTSTTPSTVTTVDSTRRFFMLGYRWDF